MCMDSATPHVSYYNNMGMELHNSQICNCQYYDLYNLMYVNEIGVISVVFPLIFTFIFSLTTDPQSGGVKNQAPASWRAWDTAWS